MVFDLGRHSAASLIPAHKTSAKHNASRGFRTEICGIATVSFMSDERFTDEYGFTGPLPVTSTQRVVPSGEFHPGLSVGEMAPDFELPSHSGEMISFHADRDGARAALLFYRSAVW